MDKFKGSAKKILFITIFFFFYFLPLVFFNDSFFEILEENKLVIYGVYFFTLSLALPLLLNYLFLTNKKNYRFYLGTIFIYPLTILLLSSFYSDVFTKLFTKTHGYTKTLLGVFHNGRLIEEADSESFMVLKEGNLGIDQEPNYAKDSNYVFINDNILVGADPISFSLIPHNLKEATLYAKDKQSVFFLNQKIPKADPNTFNPIHKSYFITKGKLIHHIFGTNYSELSCPRISKESFPKILEHRIISDEQGFCWANCRFPFKKEEGAYSFKSKLGPVNVKDDTITFYLHCTKSELQSTNLKLDKKYPHSEILFSHRGDGVYLVIIKDHLETSLIYFKPKDSVRKKIILENILPQFQNKDFKFFGENNPLLYFFIQNNLYFFNYGKVEFKKMSCKEIHQASDLLKANGHKEEINFLLTSCQK